MNVLPDKAIDIELLRIKHNMRKICSCENPLYDVDANNRAVWCRVCGAWIDPFEALLYIAGCTEKMDQEIDSRYENINCLYEKQKEAYEKIQKLNSEIEVLTKKRVRLNVFKEIERSYRDDMLPRCPECGKAFDFIKITRWINKKYLGLLEQPLGLLRSTKNEKT